MAGTPYRFIPDILEENLDELGFLWGQRQSGLRDPDYTLRDFSGLEERIQARLQGILVVGEKAIPLLEESIQADDTLDVFAGAFTLLHLGTEAAITLVLDAFSNADGDRLIGLRQALSHGPIDRAKSEIEGLYESGPAPIAAAAAEILAFHGALRASNREIERFLVDEEPSIRQSGWRLVSYLGLSLEPKMYGAAMRDEDADTRREALLAGAWCGEHGVLQLGRKLAEQPSHDNLDALEMLAILGGPQDLDLMSGVAACVDLGPERFRLLGSYGHPALMDVLLEGISNPDVATAAAAGAAFTKMTGVNIEADRRAALPPPGGSEPDEFETEFLDQVLLPEPELAHAHWDEVKGKLSAATRVCRGYDLRNGLDREEFAALDMESRWEICLRARFSGAWKSSPLSLEVFPQRK